MSTSTAEIVAEFGPFAGIESMHGVTHDGERVWFASGDKLNAFDPESKTIQRSIDVAAHAGTAFDARQRQLRHGVGRRRAVARHMGR